MKNNPLVTVVIVTWNRKEELKKAIESVYAQTYKNIEIIVMDNHSTDGSYEFTKGMYPDIKIMRTHKNIGCPPARNFAFANANGEIIFSLDDDGWLDPFCIDIAVKCFNEYDNDNIAIVSFNVVNVDDDVSIQDINSWKSYSHNEKCDYVSIFTGCAFAIKKEILEKISYFPEYFRQAEETFLSLRILDNKYMILYNPNAIMYHKLSKIRIQRDIIYFGFRHDVENIKRLIPLLYALPIIGYKFLIHFKSYMVRGYFLEYFSDSFKILPLVFKKFTDKKIKLETFIFFIKLKKSNKR